MPPLAGSRVGRHQIVPPIGASAMGDAHRARGVKLNRDGAGMVLLPTVANDLERLARVRREAQVFAPVEIPTLADRIAPMRIHVNEALPAAETDRRSGRSRDEQS